KIPPRPNRSVEAHDDDAGDGSQSPRQLRGQAERTGQFDLVSLLAAVADQDEAHDALPAPLALRLDRRQALRRSGEDRELAAELFARRLDGIGPQEPQPHAIGARFGADLDNHGTSRFETMAVIGDLFG